jgi:regulatory protein
MEAALAAVARRPRSSFELKQLLRRRGYSESDSAGAVARLEDLGYVDDLEYASVVAASVARAKGWGPARVRQELVRRGLSGDVIETALSRAAAEGSHPSGNIDGALARLLRQRGTPRGRPERDRMRAALMRRGYSSAEITRVMEGLEGGSGEEDGEET